MKNNATFKIWLEMLFLIVLTISMVIGFSWNFTATYANAKTLWLILKIVVSLFFVLQMILIILPNSRFSTALPTTITVFILQFLPMVARIRFSSATWPIVLSLLGLLLFVFFYGMRTLSNQKFLEDQDKAKHSSNYQG